jgi:hypothetical protein
MLTPLYTGIGLGGTVRKSELSRIFGSTVYLPAILTKTGARNHKKNFFKQNNGFPYSL